jgi:heme exporter protein A
MDDGSLIEVRGATKRYDRKPILRGVDLCVDGGEVVALLGANGAGKTTLMRVISGLSQPDRGEVRLGGATFAAGGHELRRYIGLVGHAPLLYDNLSAQENLDFFAHLYDMNAPDSRIEWVLRAVDLWPRRRDLVRTYSRGMTQRLAIARAILHDPPVLLLDEPDTGLDQESADLLHGLIRRLGAANRAVLLTTHNLGRAREWSDRVAMLVNGKIAYTSMTAHLSDDDLRIRYREASQSA